MLKLPRQIEGEPRAEALEAMLAQDVRPLWADGTLAVPHVLFGQSLESSLVDARGHRQLERGLEHIESVLRGEKKGLDAQREKQGAPLANRVSRLLIIADDGAERFYRQCEVVLLNHRDRVLGLRVDVPSRRLAERLYSADALVKVLLVSERAAVTNALLSLLD